MNAKAYYELLGRLDVLNVELTNRTRRIEELEAKVATLERLLANATRSTGKKEAA